MIWLLCIFSISVNVIFLFTWIHKKFLQNSSAYIISFENFLEEERKIRSECDHSIHLDEFTYKNKYDLRLTVLENMPLPFWVYDIEAMREFWANSAALNLWKCTLNEFHDKTFKTMSKAYKRYYKQKSLQGFTVANITIYPHNVPVNLKVILFMFPLSSGRKCLGVISLGETNGIDPYVQRAKESVNHISSWIYIYCSEQQLLFENWACEKSVDLSRSKVFLGHIKNRPEVKKIKKMLDDPTWKTHSLTVEVGYKNKTGIIITIFILFKLLKSTN